MSDDFDPTERERRAQHDPSTERDNRWEHREDHKDYLKDRKEDAAVRDETAVEVQAMIERKAEQTEKVRVARADELERLVQQKERTHKRIGLMQLCAYLLIITVSGLGWLSLEQKDDRICDSAQENRMAVRNVVLAIETLGTELIQDDDRPEGAEATPEQQEALEEFAEFKNAQLKLLDLPPCD